MSYAIEQSSTWDGSEGEDWWKWSVWIVADDAELDELAWVEYRLHPTFPKPIVRTKDRESGFRLDQSGWGEFVIQARLYLKDSKEYIELEHWLELERPSGVGGAARGETRGGGLPESAADSPTRVVVTVGPGQEELGALVAQALEEDGVDVSTADDAQPGVPLEVHMERTIGGADALVAVIGKRGSKWVERDMKLAQSHSVPILPIMVGETAEGPSSILDLDVKRLLTGIDDEAGLRDVAENVQGLVKEFPRTSMRGLEKA